MRKLLFGLSLPVIALYLSSCSKSSSPAPSTSSVMFVNGYFTGTSSVNLDAYSNGISVPGATAIPLLGNSGYQQITSGSGIALAFYPAGIATKLVGQTVNLSIGSYYSAFAGGSITQPSMVFSADDLTAPATGMAKCRFVNLSPDSLNLNCFIGAPKVDSGVSYLTVTPFFTVTAGSYNIGLYDQASSNKNAQLASKQLSAGRIYTFVLTGSYPQYTLTQIINY